jgi:medium-chain acyl-[acyl-carrier-protein] hydrolase
LFCISHAGGGTPVFRNWAEQLGPSIEVSAVQLPGRGTRLGEQPFGSLEHLVPELAKNIIGCLDRPFAFYGHSLGALIAFETVRALRRMGSSPPRALFVGACQAPQLQCPYPPMHQLAEAEFIDEVQRRYNGVPRQIVEDLELRALLIPTLRADIQIFETYRYSIEKPLSCPIVAFGGTRDQLVGISGLRAWSEHSTNSFRLEMIDGDHFFLNSAREDLLDGIRSRLTTGFGDEIQE